MHVFLAVLIIFLSPTPANPSGAVQMSGFKADSYQECVARLPSTISVLEQRPGVERVDGTCLTADGPERKAA